MQSTNFRCMTFFCIMWLIGGFLSESSHAASALVTDEQGKPFANAVISLTKALPNSTPTQLGSTAVMDQLEKQFSPTILVVGQDTTVVFPNSDNIRHHVYSFSEPKPFEIKLFANERVPPIFFDKPGIVVLGCNIHDSMLGFIYVKESKQVWVTNEQGIADIGEAIGEVTIWHPDFSVDHLQRMSGILVSGAPNEFTYNRVLPTKAHKKTFGSSKFNR